MNSNLPKLYRVVDIKFWSLRNGIGNGLGVILDIDTLVTRKARRVLSVNGWIWQLLLMKNQHEWDYCIETDIEIIEQVDFKVEEWSSQ